MPEKTKHELTDEERQQVENVVKKFKEFLWIVGGLILLYLVHVYIL